MKECLTNNSESHSKACELVSQLGMNSPELPPPLASIHLKNRISLSIQHKAYSHNISVYFYLLQYYKVIIHGDL